MEQKPARIFEDFRVCCRLARAQREGIRHERAKGLQGNPRARIRREA
jgi:hypothetical protein